MKKFDLLLFWRQPPCDSAASTVDRFRLSRPPAVRIAPNALDATARTQNECDHNHEAWPSHHSANLTMAQVRRCCLHSTQNARAEGFERNCWFRQLWLRERRRHSEVNWQKVYFNGIWERCA